jgi:hypothetical protein
MEEIVPRTSKGLIEVEPQIKHIVDKFPDCGLYVVEGLQGFLPNTARGQSENKAEQLWALRLRDEILNKGKTILATTHSPKAIEGYKHNRENMLGSQALIGAAGTIVHFALPETGAKRDLVQTTDRVVTVMGHDFKRSRQMLLGRHFIRDAGMLYLSFRPHKALRQGRLRQQKRFRNFGRAESAERTKSKSNLRIDVNCRVATGEDQTQAIIGKFHGV